MTDNWIVEVNEKDKIVDKVDRDIAHNTNTLRLHREVMLLLYTDKLHKKFLLQHRSMNKKQFPGLWTLSVTGHVDYTDIVPTDLEGYLTAAKREAKEEIGVEINNLVFVGRKIQNNEENLAMMGIVTGEYQGEIKLDTQEVSEVKVIDKDTIFELDDKLTPGAKTCLKYLGILNN